MPHEKAHPEFQVRDRSITGLKRAAAGPRNGHGRRPRIARRARCVRRRGGRRRRRPGSPGAPARGSRRPCSERSRRARRAQALPPHRRPSLRRPTVRHRPRPRPSWRRRRAVAAPGGADPGTARAPGCPDRRRACTAAGRWCRGWRTGSVRRSSAPTRTAEGISSITPRSTSPWGRPSASSPVRARSASLSSKSTSTASATIGAITLTRPPSAAARIAARS